MVTSVLKGYAGLILWVNLSKEKIFSRKVTKEFARTYLGGRGFASHILYAVDPRVVPLGPENVIVFAAGPLNATPWPQSGRFTVAAKSPLTGIWGESHSGGSWGAKLRFAGYDAIVVTGRSKSPVYLWIKDGHTEIRSAREIWGNNSQIANELIKEDVGDSKVETVTIGQAGENLVRFAAILNFAKRTGVSARSGMGAVMGSKNLKGIAVQGSKEIELFDSERFIELAISAVRRLNDHPFTKSLKKYGTSILVEAMNEIGRLPTRNHQSGVFLEAERIGGEKINHDYKVGNVGCYNCPICCKQVIEIKSYSHRLIRGEAPEYETLCSLGSRVGSCDFNNLAYCNDLCNKYGMDTNSVGGVIAFAMECYEKGIITSKDVDGLELTWGNPEAIIELIHQIANKEGFGYILAEGVKRSATKIGKGSEKIAMHVKGLEISAQDGRAQKSMGLAHATSARGADHLYAYAVLDELGFEDALAERFGEERLPEIGDRLNPMYKAFMVKESEDLCALVDSLVICKFGTGWPPVFYFKDLAEIVSAATGFKLNETDMRITGERIVNMNRAFNVRLGITRKDDMLPDRFLNEPAPEGPPKGHVVELEQMLDEYYEHRRWDKKTGLPTRYGLERLGLENIANDLRNSGYLI